MSQQRKVTHDTQLVVVGNERDIPNQAIPYSLEAEHATLGGVIIHGDHYHVVAPFIRDPRAFFILRHQYIWHAIQTIAERGDKVDYVTVTQQLVDVGKLDDVGGAAYVTELVNSVMSSVDLKPYAQIIDRFYTRRKILNATEEIKQLALDTTLTTDQVKDKVEAAIADATSSQRLRDTANIHEAVSRFYTVLEDIEKNGTPPCIPTGIRDLDVLLNGGLFRHKLTFLGGRPGMGKSALMINMAVNAARLGARVAFFTMEMPEHDLVRRMVAAETGVKLDKLITGQGLTPQDRAKIAEGVGRLAAFKTRLHIDSSPSFTPQELFNKCIALNAEHGLDLVMVDYLGLMRGRPEQTEERQRMTYLADMLRYIKDHQKLNAAFFVAAQLNRDLEKRNDKRPILSDLRESGRIEENADLVMFLHREKRYNEALTDDTAEIIIPKNRDGRTGTIYARFLEEYTKFVSI